MRKSQFSEEKIIAILKEAEAGAKVTELVRRLGSLKRAILASTK